MRILRRGQRGITSQPNNTRTIYACGLLSLRGDSDCTLYVALRMLWGWGGDSTPRPSRLSPLAVRAEFLCSDVKMVDWQPDLPDYTSSAETRQIVAAHSLGSKRASAEDGKRGAQPPVG